MQYMVGVFEVSMLQFTTKTCSCCGVTCPIHVDPSYPTNTPHALSRAHLSMKFHDAWECNCIDACGGQQFFASSRPTIMSCYLRLHNNQRPEVVTGSPYTNAILCSSCYYEFKHEKDSDSDLDNGTITQFAIIFHNTYNIYSSPLLQK